jgi:pilus assembly protein Flp/PilA
MRALRTLGPNDRGATAIEYALIATFIAIAIIATVQGIGNVLQNTFNNVGSNMKAS